MNGCDIKFLISSYLFLIYPAEEETFLRSSFVSVQNKNELISEQ